ncbi:hypothetical protein STEG23_008441, partial [Scotinomys teguina]
MFCGFGNFYILSSWRSGVFSPCCLALDSSSSFPCPAFRAIAKSYMEYGKEQGLEMIRKCMQMLSLAAMPTQSSVLVGIVGQKIGLKHVTLATRMSVLASFPQHLLFLLL